MNKWLKRALIGASILGLSVSVADTSDWTFWDSFEVKHVDLTENIIPLPITDMKLVSVSSLATTSAQVDWLAGVSSSTSAKDLRYDIHFSTVEDFQPSAASIVKSITGQTKATLSALVDGLVADTQYHVMVTATDKNNNVVQTNRLTVTTAESPIVRTGNNAYELPKSDTGGSQEVLDGKVIVPSTAKTVKVGDIIANKDNGGYLRKVTGIKQENGKTVLETEQAPINEVFSDLDLSFATKMIKNPANGRSGIITRRSKAGSNDELVWEEGNLTLSYPANANAHEKVQISPRASFAHVESNSVLAISTKQDTYTFSADGNEELRFEVKIELKDNNYHFPELELVDLYREQGWSDTHFTQEAHLYPAGGNSYFFGWKPSKDKNDEREYVAVFKAKAQKHSNCGLFGCGSSDVTLRVPIYIGSEPTTEGNDKLVKVEGDFTVETEVGVVFEPTANANFELRGRKIERAALFFNGDLSMSAKALLEAKGAASASAEKDIPALQRQFIKTFITPSGIPIVVRGELGVEVAFDANVSAELSVKPEYTHHFNVKLGFEYTSNNGWQPIKSASQRPHVEMKGKAKGEMDITIGLKPRFNVSFYEVGVLKTNVVPYIFNETKLEGEYDFLLGEPNGGLCFTQFDNGGGIDFNIHAGLEAWGWGIVGYPSRDPDSFKEFTVVPKTVLLGLPQLSTAIETTAPTPPMDSRSILVSATPKNLPFMGGDSINPWASGHWSRVIPRAESSIISVAGKNQGWVTYQQASGKYTASFFGHSRIGSLFQQCADQVINIKDADNDGMADQWESQFNVTDPNADSDCDGKTNLEEFNAGTYPTEKACTEKITITSPNNGETLPANKKILSAGTATPNTDVMINVNGSKICTEKSDAVGLWWCDIPASYAVESATLTITASATGAQTQTLSVKIDKAVTPPPTGGTTHPTKLNDTGITACGTADGTSNSESCSGAVADASGSEIPQGQDGHYGTGKNASKGMSFSHVPGYAGKCVQDNHTGLMWEVKQGGDGTQGNEGLHDADDRYNWYSDTNNNGNAGYKDDDGAICHGYDSSSESTFCNTQAYVARVNSVGWCGRSDWRLPTREELRSIVDYSRINPAIDTSFFPNTQSVRSWSSSPNADDNYYAWVVYFYDGYDDSYNKDYDLYVRLVRGGQ